MTSPIDEALDQSPTVDITTTGRRSGLSRRIEIWMFRVGGRYVITGTPGRRDWYGNLLADGRLTVHVPRQSLDLPALAVPIEDAVFRRTVFTASHVSWYGSQAELESLVQHAPMVEIRFP